MILTRVRLATGALALAAAAISAYSEIGPVPLRVLGLAAYVGIALAAAFRGELAALAGFALGLSAGIFAVYLIVVQTVVLLHAICIWCMASDSIALVLVVLGVLRLRDELRASDAAWCVRVLREPGCPATGRG